MNAKVLSGLLLAFLFSAALVSSRAQAATEYGLTAASSAGSTSGVAKVFNQKLNADRVESGASHQTTTVVHNVRPAASKPTGTNTKNTAAAVTNSAPKQAGSSGQHSRGPDPFGMTIVGADHH